MHAHIAIFSCLVVILLSIPVSMAIEAHEVYKCNNSVLEINRTSIIAGNYQELFFDNISCGAMGCAYNAIECNSPMNVDRLGAAISALIFMIAGALFFIFGTQLKEVNRLYYSLKYLHIFSAFFMFMLGLLLVWGLYSLGQNEITDTYFIGFMFMLGLIIVTALSLFIYEMQQYVKMLTKSGRSL